MLLMNEMKNVFAIIKKKSCNDADAAPDFNVQFFSFSTDENVKHMHEFISMSLHHR